MTEFADKTMAWETVQGPTVLDSMQEIGYVVAHVESTSKDILDLVEEGVDKDWGTLTVTLRDLDVQAVTLGLHLTGFFSELLKERSKELMGRLFDISKEVIDAHTEEEREAIEEAYGRVQEKRQLQALAGLMGITEEEARERVGEAAAAYRAAEDAEPEPVTQGSWSAAAPEDDEA